MKTILAVLGWLALLFSLCESQTRVVVTFYNSKQAEANYTFTHKGITSVKQYGRRLVLSIPSDIKEDLYDTVVRDINETLIELIELDAQVSLLSVNT
jgi:hypothetical protein